MQELREAEGKARKKAKKLAKEKKELQSKLGQVEEEYHRQREYYNTLIEDLELKLREMINAN